MVDGVVLAAPPPPSRRREADRVARHAGDDPGGSAWASTITGADAMVVVGALERSAGRRAPPPSGRTPPAAGTRFQGARGRRRAPSGEQLLAEPVRDLEQARVARAPVRWSIDSRTSTALPPCGQSGPCGQQLAVAGRCRRPPRGSSGASSRAWSSSGRKAPERLDVHHERVEPRASFLERDRWRRSADRLQPCPWRRGSRTAAGRRGEVAGLADDRAARLATVAAKRSGPAPCRSRGSVELVERAAGVARPRPRDQSRAAPPHAATIGRSSSDTLSPTPAGGACRHRASSPTADCPSASSPGQRHARVALIPLMTIAIPLRPVRRSPSRR